MFAKLSAAHGKDQLRPRARRFRISGRRGPAVFANNGLSIFSHFGIGRIAEICPTGSHEEIRFMIKISMMVLFMVMSSSCSSEHELKLTYLILPNFQALKTKTPDLYLFEMGRKEDNQRIFIINDPAMIGAMRSSIAEMRTELLQKEPEIVPLVFEETTACTDDVVLVDNRLGNDGQVKTVNYLIISRLRLMHDADSGAWSSIINDMRRVIFDDKRGGTEVVRIAPGGFEKKSIRAIAVLWKP
jgi:hypothetical protein